jgi:hypothetical protein
MRDENSDNWRKLCAAAAVEEDSAKLASLVDEIIKSLDRSKAEQEFLPATQVSASPQSTGRRRTA